MTHDEAVEKVAEALWQQAPKIVDGDWANISEPHKQWFREMAQAALTALNFDAYRELAEAVEVCLPLVQMMAGTHVRPIELALSRIKETS